MESTYRALAPEEAARIREIDALDYIARAWRRVDGAYRWIDLCYEDPDYPEGYEAHLARVQATLAEGGLVLGAFAGDRLMGFVALRRRLFGSREQYALLDQLFIHRPLRGQGMGRALMERAAEAAHSWGAEKLYLCAGSAEGTLAFYRRIGCVEAEEIEEALREADPNDLQLEWKI